MRNIIYTWPAVPFEFEKAGYKDGLRDNLIRNNPDIGPAMSRARTTFTPYELLGKIEMSADEVNLFEDYFLNILKSGKNIFEFIHPRKQVLMHWRMVEPPKPVPYLGNFWHVHVKFIQVPGGGAS